MTDNRYSYKKTLPSFLSRALLGIVISIVLQPVMAYAESGEASQLSFMESARNIIIFKGLGVFAVVATLAIMVVTKQALNSRKSIVVGVLLATYGLLMLSIWFVNYVVISMGLIALSGIVLMFKNGIGKLIYMFAALFLSFYASLEYGADSRDFIVSVSFIYIIGIALFLFVPDDLASTDLSYESNTPIDDKILAKQRLQYQKLMKRVENSASIDPKKNKVIVKRFASGLLLVALISLAFSAFIS